MAIYRPPKPRWRAALVGGLAGVAVGVLVGVLASRADPDPAEAARAVRSELNRAASSLDVVAIEYAESVDAGEVVQEAEYEGAKDALASSRARFDDVRAAVEVLDPERAASIAEGYDAIEQRVESRAAPAEVRSEIDSLVALLQGD